MTFDIASDLSSSTIATRRSGEIYEKYTDNGIERLSGYVSGTSSSRSATVLPKGHAPRRSLQPTGALQASYDALRRYLTSAVSQAGLMVRVAQTGDVIELANSGFLLRDILSELWNLRGIREDDWGDLVNLLQGALAGEEFEKFSVYQCESIRSVIADHLASGITDIDDLDSVVALLRNAGFDPFKTISGE